MAGLDGFGASALDAAAGMELAKANNRRDRDDLRNQARLDVQDKLTAYGLEDAERSRGDAAARRAAVAGKTTVSEAAKAAEAASLSRGDLGGAKDAGKGRLEALMNDFKATELELETKLVPEMEKIRTAQVQGQASRQPGLETIANQDLDDKTKAGTERLIARAYQIAQSDTNAAAALLSNSPLLFPGKKVTGIMQSKDGSKIAIVGEDGQPLTVLDRRHLDNLATKYSDPGKIMEVEKDKRLVHVTPGGKAKEIYAAPDKPVTGKFTLGPNGEVLDTRTGAVSPGAGLGGNTKRQDQRTKDALSVIVRNYGGQFDALGQMSLKSGTENMVRRASVLAEEYIKAGADPVAAANKAVEAADRESKIAGLGSTGTTTAPAAINWQDFIQSPQQIP